MKKTKILTVCLCATLSLSAMFVGCESNPDGGEKVDKNCTIEYARYEGLSTLASAEEIAEYESDVSTNLPDENGVIVSPHYTLKINDETVPVYATRSAGGVHSFAYIDVRLTDKTKGFLLDVEINGSELSTVFNKRPNGKEPSVAVLPESAGVTASITNKTVKTQIKKYGSFSFAFNVSPEEALTLVVKPEEDVPSIFGEKNINYIEAGDYTGDKSDDLIFKNKAEVYYFKAGKYKIDGISVPEESIVYFERGAYLEVMPGKHGYPLSASKQNAVTVAGRGLIDYSACCGGEVPEGYSNNKGGLVFTECDDVKISGLTVINSQTWTLCLNDCEGVSVKDLMFFAYRVFADGVMLSDCKNAVVEDCFIRTGDDAFETKSTTYSGLTDNVLFRNNAAWTDKAVAYGCIYESSHDTRNVRFENNSVGFAMGTWSNHLGSCVVQMGNRKGAVMEKIYFKDIEIYFSANPAILNVYIGGSGGRGEGWGTVKNVYFENVTAKRNYGAFLNVRTYDSENCFIGPLYLDNIVSNGVMLTDLNYLNEGYVIDNVAGGYDFSKYLRLNTLNALDEE